jgi:hypothetical protein
MCLTLVLTLTFKNILPRKMPPTNREAFLSTNATAGRKLWPQISDLPGKQDAYVIFT